LTEQEQHRQRETLRRAQARLKEAEASLRKATDDRLLAVLAARDARMTLVAIGRELGLSKQRVGQLVEEATWRLGST
jgi:phage terminase small subunit